MVLVGAGRLLVASRDSSGRLLMCLPLVFGLAFERSAGLSGFPRPACGSKQASTISSGVPSAADPCDPLRRGDGVDRY